MEEFALSALTVFPQKNKKTRQFHEVKNNAEFFQTAELWTEYNHEYASVLAKHNVASAQKLYYPKKCNILFHEKHRMCQAKKSFLSVWKLTKQLKLTTLVLPNLRDLPQHLEEQVGHLLPHMKHQWDYVCCIICATDQTDSHGKLIPAHTVEMPLEGQALHQGKLQLVEFVEIHQN